MAILWDLIKVFSILTYKASSFLIREISKTSKTTDLYKAYKEGYDEEMNKKRLGNYIYKNGSTEKREF